MRNDMDKSINSQSKMATRESGDAHVTLLEPAMLYAVGARRIFSSQLIQAWQHIPTPLVVCDDKGEIKFVNRAFSKIVAHSALLEHHTISTLLRPIDVCVDDEECASVIPYLDQAKIVTVTTPRDGRFTRLQLDKDTLTLQKKTYHIYSLTDVSDWSRSLNKLSRQVTTDELTGALSRSHFFNQMDKEIERINRYEEPLSIAILDIDNFKFINDNYGHIAGDEALKHFANLVKSNLREVDVFGRIGGDEFAIYMPATSVNAAKNSCERILEILQDIPVQLNSNIRIPLHASIGIAQFNSMTSGSRELYELADLALYDVKRSGKNGVSINTNGTITRSA
jgi:diguanylate cyclase (GGDEF)-like protein